MSLIDWAATWEPVPDDRPCQVWLPADSPTGDAPAPRAHRPARSSVLKLSDADALQLPCRLPALLSQTDVRPGNAVTIDLASAASVHLTGLWLLLTVLWRRVGPYGDVTLLGGAPALQAQLRSLDITASAARAAVYGPLPAAPLAPGAPLTPASGAPLDTVACGHPRWAELAASRARARMRPRSGRRVHPAKRMYSSA